jgi:hypothetical protein
LHLLPSFEGEATAFPLSVNDKENRKARNVAGIVLQRSTEACRVPRTVRIDSRGAEAKLKTKPNAEPDAVKSVVQKFRQKYGAGDAKKYYSQFDMAVEAGLRSSES